MSNKPIAEIGSAEMLRRYRIGLVITCCRRRPGATSSTCRRDSFRAAFLRVKTNEGAYTADPKE